MTRKPKKPKTAWQSFLELLYLQPLFALPFGLFFGTIYGNGWGSYLPAYGLSLVFAYSIGLSIWIMERAILPRTLAAQWKPGGGRIWIHAALYSGSAIFGAYVAAAILRFTVMPDFLGGSRGFFIFTMYTLLFTLLFCGLAYSMAFYKGAIEKARAEQELNLARRIQRSFLLTQFPEMARLEVHAANISSKEVSGDFYDVLPAGERAFLLAIADVAGKGVPAALLTSMLQASLRTQAMTRTSVGEILATINHLVYRSTSVHQFATFFLARIQDDCLKLTYSNAGHNFPVLYRRGGERVTLERGGTVVGILEAARFEEGSVDLAAGDRVVFYTDGISEAENAAGEQFGEERLHAAMAELSENARAQDVVDHLLASVRSFLDGVEPGDDMTLMVLRVLDAPTARA
jgi:sigma-B regulation protein RsbU (phosphoserine phosphatase)